MICTKIEFEKTWGTENVSFGKLKDYINFFVPFFNSPPIFSAFSNPAPSFNFSLVNKYEAIVF